MAAGKPAVQITGAKELRAALKRMGRDVSDLTRVNKEVAGIVADAARDRVPVRSGKLRKSIRPGATQRTGTVAAGGRLVPYAGPIHFGWPARNIDPQPFLYDALDSRKSEVVARYQERIGDLVRKLDRETPG